MLPQPANKRLGGRNYNILTTLLTKEVARELDELKTCVRCKISKLRSDYSSNKSKMCSSCAKAERLIDFEKQQAKLREEEFKQKIYNVIKDTLEREGRATVRRLFYVVLSSGIGLRKENGYEKYIQPLVLEWRRYPTEDRFVPWDQVIDPSRDVYATPAYDGLEYYKPVVERAYQRDYWARMPTHVEILVEKDGMIPLLQAAVDDLHLKNIAIVSLHGNPSDSQISKFSERYNSVLQNCRNVLLLYFGDLDPSGLNIPRAFVTKLRKTFNVHGVVFVRVAVNPTQVERLALQTCDLKKVNPESKNANATATINKKYTAETGLKVACEIDAVSYPVLKRLLENEIWMPGVRDMEMWNKIAAREEENRQAVCRLDWSEILELDARPL